MGVGRYRPLCFCGASSWSVIFAIRGTEKVKEEILEHNMQPVVERTRYVREAASPCPTSKAPGLSQGAARGKKNSGLHAGAAWVNAWWPSIGMEELQAFITLTN